MKIAVYPGTFDPVTYGHLDVLRRASVLFDKVIVAIAANSPKEPLFPLEDRIRMVRDNLSDDCIEVCELTGLVVEFAKKMNAVALIRGLRAISDFEHEFQMAQMNRNLDGTIETIFLMPSDKYFYISSSLIKQVARYSGKDTGMVPPNVLKALRQRFAANH